MRRPESRLPNGVKRFFRLPRNRARLKRESDDEMRFHLDARVSELRAIGMSDADARAEALRRFGDSDDFRAYLERRAKRASRWFAVTQWFDATWHDVRYAVRGLRRSPMFSATVVLALALGLGLNGALFSVLERVFFRAPAGVAGPGDVRRLYYDRPHRQAGVMAPANHVFLQASWDDYENLRLALGSKATLAAYGQQTAADSVTAEVGGTIARASRLYATRSYFTAAGVRPAGGRFFSADEDRITASAPVAVVSQRFQRRAFGTDGPVVGRQFRVDKILYTVIGVAGADFTGFDLGPVDIWMPLGDLPTPSLFGEPWYEGGLEQLRLIARTNGGMTPEQLAGLATVAYRRAHDGDTRDADSRVLTGPVVAALGPAEGSASAKISVRLAAITLMVLLIACGNVANLLLLRATGRHREIAVRRALGVSQRRLATQLLLESVLLSALAAGAAVCVCFWANNALTTLLFPETSPMSAGMDTPFIGTVGLAGVVVGIGAGLAPIFGVSRMTAADALRSDAQTITSRRGWLRPSLVVVQGALSIVLLIGAGLFVRSLANLDGVNLGFTPGDLVSVRPWFWVSNRPAVGHQAHTFAETDARMKDVASTVRALPGVAHVAITSVAPLQGAYGGLVFVSGRDTNLALDGPPKLVLASPEYAGTVGLHVVSGRFFTSTDRAGSEHVAVVNQSAARVAWGTQPPLGQCIFLDSRSAPCTRVVGVVEDAHDLGVIEQPSMEVYFALDQNPYDVKNPGSPFFERLLLVRTNPGADAPVVDLLRSAGRTMFPDADEVRVTQLSQLIDRDLRPWRLGAALSTAMGVLAAVIAALGIYSVFSYAVSQRMREFAIRIALGAQLADTLRDVIGEGLRLVALSVVVGVGLALALGRLVATLLYGVAPYDPLIILGAVAALALLGIVGTLVPALTAARIDPVTALRSE